ncbi:PSPA7_2676 family Cys-rich small protein [Pseudomonas sp. EA_35y_Pfl2_R5]|uniref:PSPA7_2676 family Cys-rich small protein n=1 Tax=Pseudomonas sp. EA_35y_Pfl2_R5 TaxID=3088690 RepID=UPI0030DC6963
MTIRCLIAGCLWSPGTAIRMGREILLCQRCSRCGSFHYIPGSLMEDGHHA